jgi:two-component system, OmpR family, alkaline phosphatase synthesis response regulator PhoP
LFALHLLTLAGELSRDLLACLDREGLAYTVDGDTSDAATLGEGARPDAVLIDMTLGDQGALAGMMERSRGFRAVALTILSADRFRNLDLADGTEEFIFCPWHAGELTLRVQRLLERQQGPQDMPGTIRSGDLVINTQQYDVFLAGRTVLLTFKEYELLKLLASNTGRVFSREQLLEQVWGYQYFGGTRTVDVHIRRLRSKIEDATHTFIDTVWNVGYRFRQ